MGMHLAAIRVVEVWRVANFEQLRGGGTLLRRPLVPQKPLLV
jgi:hypothetical protein